MTASDKASNSLRSELLVLGEVLGRIVTGTLDISGHAII